MCADAHIPSSAYQWGRQCEHPEVARSCSNARAVAVALARCHDVRPPNGLGDRLTRWCGRLSLRNDFSEPINVPPCARSS